MTDTQANTTSKPDGRADDGAFLFALGRAITEARVNLGLSQAALAARLGLNQSALSRWEMGRSSLTVLDLQHVAAHLSTTAPALIEAAEKIKAANLREYEAPRIINPKRVKSTRTIRVLVESPRP
ncbi:MAG: helix-turn-helix transcriptional regulator [Burkholderiales bacterium]|nr:helix-turn-helix transcriptional regulator [Burkholderiales bacterium]